MHRPSLPLLAFLLLALQSGLSRLPAQAPVNAYSPLVQGALRGDLDLGGHAIHNGVLSPDVSLTLPTATTSAPGLVKIGSGLAVDGAGTLSLALPSSATVQGNAFNGAGQLLKLDANGNIPAPLAFAKNAGQAFVFEGDSITDAAGLGAPTVPADVASMSFFAGRGTIYDVAVSASQIPSGSGAGGTNNLADRYAARVKPHRPAANGGDGGPKAWLFVLAGVNDIYTGGKTAAQEIASLQSYVNTARADGFTVVLSPIMPVASAWGPSYEAVRLQVNAAIRNGTIASDVLVDYGTALPNPTDTSLYGDGLHPTALGHAIMARYLNNAMEAGGNLNGTAQSFFSEYLAVYNGALNLYPYATATPVTLSASGTTAVFSGPLAATGAAFSGPVSGASLALSGRLVSSPAATSSTSGYLVTGSTGDTANLNAGVLVYNNPPNVFGMDLGWKTGTNYYLRLFSEHSYPVAVAFYDASAGSPSSQSSFYTTAVFMPNGSAQFTASMEPVDNVTYPVVIKQTNTHGASAIAFNDENGNGMGVFGNFSSSSIWPNRWEWIAANPVELRDGSHNLYGYFDPANKKFRFGDGTAPSDVVESTGNVSCAVAGGTLKVKSGTNALAGTVTLSSGAATIASSAIDANTVIVLSLKTSSGTPGTFAPRTSVAAGSATVTGNAGDNSTYNWIGLKVN